MHHLSDLLRSILLICCCLAVVVIFGFSSGEKSPATIALRKKTSDGCERLIWDFFEQGGQVLIYDANNGTRAARHALAEKFDAAGIHVVLLGMFFFLCIQTKLIEPPNTQSLYAIIRR